eukprot:TRINITY_DN17207_c0_g1_i1.p1 TRINITY_DN17207_c0_g1~~TRINITY_DN17207_c0_g1_i1.p1  ORF type:complete len:222 (+),score=57.43 TRINITY_DN17207_c0_g1_i1:137-802(+)
MASARNALRLFGRGASARLNGYQQQLGGQALVTRLHSSEPARDQHEEKHETSKMVGEGGQNHTSFDEARKEVSKASQRGSDTLNEAHQKAGELKAQGESYARETADKAQDASGKAKETVEDMTEKGKQTARQAMDKTKEQAGGTMESVQSTAETVKDAAKKEANTATDMFKDAPKKASETTEGLKGVAVEAAKAVKRDAEMLAEKVGLKEPKSGDLDRTES